MDSDITPEVIIRLQLVAVPMKIKLIVKIATWDDKINRISRKVNSYINVFCLQGGD